MIDALPTSRIGRVVISERMDGVIVQPLDGIDAISIGRVLRSFASGIKCHRTHEGIHISASDAVALPRTDHLLTWDDDAKLFVENRERAGRYHSTLWSRLQELKNADPAYIREVLGDPRSMNVLDDHQVVNVAAMTMQNGSGLCIFDEQGAGKTVTGLYAHNALVQSGEIQLLLIVAPKSMVPEWREAYGKFMPDRYKVIVSSGTRDEKRQAFAKRPDVIITNYETTINMESELRSLLRATNGRAMLIVDESFQVKSPDAIRTKAIRRLREWCKRAFVLCGTPAPNSPDDLIQQFNIVDFGITFDGLDIPEDRESAISVIQNAINERGLFVRNLKSDVLPMLPAKQFHRMFVQLEPQQSRLYVGALKNLILDLQAIDEKTFRRQLTSYLARRSALLQICSNPIAIADDYIETPAKLIALDSILRRSIRESGEKVVLWSYYTSSIDTLFSRYAGYGAVRYDGKVSSIEERRNAVMRFQEDDKTMLFIGNPAAAGAGLTLHRARLAIYESMSNQAAHYLQSLDRIHRRGQERAVEYIILLCEQTIEIQEYERLVAKEQAAQHLLGDHVEQPLSRDSMLADLQAAGELLGSDLLT